MKYNELTTEIVKEKLATHSKTYKSMKELAEVLDFELAEGVHRKRQIAYLRTLIKIATKRNSNQIKIVEIYDVQREPKKRKPKPRKKFCVPREIEGHRGLYCITTNSHKLFIGCVYGNKGFRGKYKDCKEKTKVTKEMLATKFGRFYCLLDMEGIEDIELIEMLCAETIEWAIANTDWNVVNTKKTKSLVKEDNKPKRKKVAFTITEKEKKLLRKYLAELRANELKE